MASRATLTMTRPPARLATISSVWATAGRGTVAQASTNRNALLIDTFQRPLEPLGGLKLGYSFAESPGGPGWPCTPRRSFGSLTRAGRTAASLPKRERAMLQCFAATIRAAEGESGHSLA